MAEMSEEAGFAGTVALVTGAAGGIGAAVARALAERGARVAVADLAELPVRKLAGEVDGLGIGLDVRDPDSVFAAVAETTRVLGPVEVLVNSAGVVGGAGPLRSLPVEAFTAALEVNLLGTFLLTRAVGNAMAEAGTGGAIVHLSSAGAFQPTAGLGHYEATKAGVNALTRSAALELAPHRIRVNAIAPGPVDTPLTSEALAEPAARAAWTSRIPLGRIAEPADLVPLVLLLASEQGRHITGTVLPVEGGQLLGSVS
ncbi:SDR family NAD(P)-dependent oxidoreductase [Amycolatopsis cihanbeyliensis]|uniref:NAD(P)-dependent dehydrogenase (Short-subunit alcohol dehydrogenase family) n=1 Tax=Amycolatopsis cihanbeyliensis TaxID=1128664 RepID=A0A542CSG4_AMYCI|nr:SDR family oxidoreductase [Amycolatopsis cihanbeyliensis]TQI93765.1 NAD(P)-dependent dehydrogenase (short-subunit alcohol dehydrogenase family) [Amycolatopsis cihanbeyliensis]